MKGENDILSITRSCICCGNEIKPLQHKENDNPSQGMWLNGVVDKIAANYGSSLDGDMYIIAICDKCIKVKVEEGSVEYAGNYMGN